MQTDRLTPKVYIKIGAKLVDNSEWDLPDDRTFREAWGFKDDSMATGVIVTDMVKAREIWRDRIREARDPVLKQLDTEFMMALEKGKDTSAIVAKKQALRDATKDPAIEAAKTPEDLKKVQPAGLKIED